ncbi:competence protein ComEC [Pseudovibrio denitrificans]|uniref:Competence protein ComEC n=1 Tax=Pseudovibrio denitrificans TaxID=258256 RepID=A0A1I7BUM7_9HYPH|nr:ComEC/Rec2 family competence protein [Pseudovibrio denitrificans]SFT90884.1 competence protein ComEC [Pseudovibrio denitrificans]
MREGQSSSDKTQSGGSAPRIDALCLKGDKFSSRAFEGDLLPAEDDLQALRTQQRRKTQTNAKNAHSNATEDFYDENQYVGMWGRCVAAVVTIRAVFFWIVRPDWPAAMSYARTALSQDWDRGQGIVWYALSHMAGVLVYFSLPAEPYSVLSGLVAILLGLFAFRRMKRGRSTIGLTALLFFALGFILSDLRVEFARGDPLERPVTRKVEGVVTGLKQSGQHSYSVILGEVLEHSKRGTTPLGYKIRLSLKGMKEAPVMGDKMQLKARLLPPGGAVRPGGYDFARTAFFDGIGAVGYALSRPVVLARDGGTGFLQHVDTIRSGIAGRIRRVLDYSPESAFAVALLVGKRDYLASADKDALRNAGLAHVLAISGMHMGLVTSLVFLAARLVLSLSQSLALKGHIHVYASIAALIAATVYLSLSGASVATQRAYMMAVMILCAGLLGRRAFSLRGLALACLLLLSLRPEEVLSPGFQMSFIAVLALLSAYSFGKDWLRDDREAYVLKGKTGILRTLRKPVKWLFACAMTSLIAGAATAPIAAMHFEQIAPYGVVGNVLAMPLVTFVVMPLGLLALLTIPFGADAFFLQGMEVGLSLVLKAAYWVSALSDGLTNLGVASVSGYLLVILASIILCIMPLRLKWLSVPAFAAGLIGFVVERPPDVMIADAGKHIGFYGKDGSFRLTSSRMSFAADSLLRAGGYSANSFKEHKTRAADRSCDEEGCVLEIYPHRAMGGGGEQKPSVLLAQSKGMSVLEADCQLASIIVTQAQAPSSCNAELVLDQKIFGERGSVYIWLSDQAGNGHKIKKVRWAYDAQRRPWNPKLPIATSALIAAEERNHLALNADTPRAEDASFVGGVGRFKRN